MTDLATLLRSLDEGGARPDEAFAARMTDLFVAAATGAEMPAAEPVRAPAEPVARPRRRLLAAVAAAAAVIGIAVGIAVLRGEPAREPLPPATPVPSAPASAAPSPSPSASPVVRGWGSPVPAPRAVRDWSAQAWTGTEWFVWGGRDDCTGCAQAPIATGALFEPGTGQWRAVPAAPAAAYSAAAVWTGTEVLVYGGLGADGREAPPMAFDPAAGTWRRLPAAPIRLRANTYHPQVVWTGEELFVWGGQPLTEQFTQDPTQPDVGVAYSPGTNRWRTLPRAPVSSFRSEYAIAWTGSEVVVCCGGEADGAAYDPSAGTWRRIATPPVRTRTVAAYGWTGRELVVYGGYGAPSGEDGPTPVLATGAAYDPAADTWRQLPRSPLTPRLQPGFATSTDGLLFVWGGQVFEPERRYRDGALYDGTAWTRLPALGLAGNDLRGSRATWTGRQFLLLTTSGTALPRRYAAVAYTP